MNSISETDFGSALRDVFEGKKTIDTILEHPAFTSMLNLLCRRLVRNNDDANELFQDVCLKILKHQPLFRTSGLKDERAFFGWLRVVARSVSIDRYRKQGQKAELLTDQLNIPDEKMDLDREFAEKRFRSDFQRCIANLPRERRLAATLCVFGGYSSREIARILNDQGIKCSHMTVNKWTRDALLMLFPERSGYGINVTRKQSRIAKQRDKKVLSNVNHSSSQNRS